jgi:hypothetical protein
MLLLLFLSMLSLVKVNDSEFHLFLFFFPSEELLFWKIFLGHENPGRYVGVFFCAASP